MGILDKINISCPCQEMVYIFHSSYCSAIVIKSVAAIPADGLRNLVCAASARQSPAVPRALHSASCGSVTLLTALGMVCICVVKYPVSSQGIAMATMRFRFDGQPINESDTPISLEMEEGDTIEVYQQQTGGRRPYITC
jgi:small ubiquitin-related modifier